MAQGRLRRLWERICYEANMIWEAVQRAWHGMWRTLFTRYLLATSAIVLVCFILFGVLLASAVSGQWRDEKQQLLVDNVNVIAQRASKYIVQATNPDGTPGNYEMSEAASRTLRSSMSVIGQSIGADLFVLGTDNTVLVCSEEDTLSVASADAGAVCRHKNALPENFFSNALGNADPATRIYRSTDNMGGIYNESQFVVGAPVIVVNASGTEVIVGMVVAASSARSIEEFRSEVANIVIIAIIIASLASLVAVYAITYSQVKPLREMASVVRKFAGGDYTARMQVPDETEVGQLAASFNQMAGVIESSELMRRSFVANVSHELKTPMTTISGFVDGILDGTIPEDRRTHYLTVVSSETKRLSRLVRSMLDLSRIDSGELKLNYQRFDISKTVTNTLLSFEQRIEEKQIDIQGMEQIKPLYIRGDPDLLHQVVYNLMENAVKFTNEGGYISIKVYSRERSAYVRIANSGIGIPSEDLPRIFERFYKSDKSRSHDKTGVGLGLFIVKTVIGLHNGEIEVRSSEGTSCEFEFHIPV